MNRLAYNKGNTVLHQREKFLKNIMIPRMLNASLIIKAFGG